MECSTYSAPVRNPVLTLIQSHAADAVRVGGRRTARAVNGLIRTAANPQEYRRIMRSL